MELCKFLRMVVVLSLRGSSAIQLLSDEWLTAGRRSHIGGPLGRSGVSVVKRKRREVETAKTKIRLFGDCKGSRRALGTFVPKASSAIVIQVRFARFAPMRSLL